jgi:hypothetical protein
MGMIDTFKQRVREASPQARTALVSECAERVYPLYEEMWGGSYYVAVRRGIEMGWNFACGLPIDEDLKARLLEHMLDAVTFFREDATRDDLLANPLTVALRGLQSMVEDEEESCLAVARGLGSTLSSAQSAGNRPRDDDNEKRAMAEEEAWQDEALTLIDGWQGVAKRDMFDTIGEKPPGWLHDWRMRRVRE